MKKLAIVFVGIAREVIEAIAINIWGVTPKVARAVSAAFCCPDEHPERVALRERVAQNQRQRALRK